MSWSDGQHHHDRLRIPGGDQADAEGDGGRGVALGGLGEDVFRREHGGERADGILLQGIGENQDVFQRNQPVEAADGLLQQRSVAEKIEELFGLVIAAERPEAGAGASGEDQGVGVFESWHFAERFD